MPVDGFHPDQTTMALAANVLVDALEKDAPHFLGDINPHNEMIKKLFGNQGGHKRILRECTLSCKFWFVQNTKFQSNHS